MDETRRINIVSSAADLRNAQEKVNQEARRFVQLFSDRWLFGGGNEHTYVHRDDVNKLRAALVELDKVQQARKVQGNGQ